MSMTRFVLHYLKGYVPWALLAGAAILVFGLSTAAMVSLVQPIFAEVLRLESDQMPASVAVVPGAEPEAAETGGTAGDDIDFGFDFKALLDQGYEAFKRYFGVTAQNVHFYVPLLFLVVFGLRSFSNFVSGYSFQRIGLGVTTDIRNDLYRSVLHQSSRFHAEHTSGELVARVVSDVGLMQSAVSNRMLDLFQQGISLIFLLALLLSTHLQLALICLVLGSVILVLIVRFGEGMRRYSHRSQERMADLAGLVNEGVRGHRVVKAFGMEEFEYRRFKEATRRHLRVNLWAQLLANLSGPVIETMAVLGTSVLLIYAGNRIRAGELSGPLLLQFLTNLLIMYEPIRKLNRVNLALQQSRAAAQRITGVLEIPNEIVERPDAEPLHTIERDIRFDDVSFSYGEELVLKNIDLTIRRGEIVAVVGPSGAGKSTLVNLLPRFFDPTSGRVLIDSRPIRDVTLDSLRALIGLVTQDTILFDDTVAANIAYGRVGVPLEKIREAAAAAYADEFILELPKGYDTRVGESGLRLSGGQRQRLTIARALFKNPPILILDEATSQLDPESEGLVRKALDNLMRGRTTLVIAHRLSTVQHADRIVVMEEGRIVEEGRHADLIERGGVYQRLYNLQFQV
ncbi:MAG: ABC transporter ATP-binding protein [Thermoanaerobaculia bacterium]|nr:ABC transporter ATP-binding protein [Thermoanaerobaculia bacterium]